ncbi:hypothetical protein MKX01_038884, partial [Papaver californicum]
MEKILEKIHSHDSSSSSSSDSDNENEVKHHSVSSSSSPKVLFLWSNASTFIQKSRPKIPEVHLPEDPFLQIAAGLRIEINKALACLREIASGHDLKKFLACLYLLIVVSSYCSTINYI